jgi:ComF family protein
MPLLSNRVCSILHRAMAACGRAIGDLVFPWSCVLCGLEGSELCGPLCEFCREELLHESSSSRSVTCPRCALPAGPYANFRNGCSQCRGKSLGFDAAMALGPYQGALRDLCLRLKHEREAWLAPWLGGLLAESWHTELTRLPHETWIVPVPLHWWRRVRRGYNQAEAIARGLGRGLGFPVRQPLRRIKFAEALAQKKASERAKVLHGAFQARSGRARTLKGRTILLVDDILTTGATSGAAARALKQAGARHVVVAVLARTL